MKATERNILHPEARHDSFHYASRKVRTTRACSTGN